MIVIVGSLAWRDAPPAAPAGRACGIALAAATHGARVEVVGRVGDDPRGDTLLIALAHARVGHAAVLRDPVRPTPVVASVTEPEEPDILAEAEAEAEATPASPVVTGPRLQRADVALGLQYLTAFGVLVVADDVAPDALPACVEGAGFAGAHLVVLVPAGRSLPDGMPADATVLAAPDDPDDAAFAGLVGTYAAAVDAGESPAAAFRAATGAAGWAATEGFEGTGPA